MTLAITACLWDANEHSERFSLEYDETWAVKLFNGFDRHLTVPHRAVLFTDRRRNLPAHIEQIVQPDLGSNGYGDCIRPFMLDEPMIFAGLDTIIVGDCDKFARWALEHPGEIALPKHPYNDLSINGVVFCGAGNRRIYDDWRGENDMEWLRGFPHQRIDDLWPGKVVSWKAHCLPVVPEKARIIYFHGLKKPGHIRSPFIRKHWR